MIIGKFKKRSDMGPVEQTLTDMIMIVLLLLIIMALIFAARYYF